MPEKNEIPGSAAKRLAVAALAGLALGGCAWFHGPKAAPESPTVARVGDTTISEADLQKGLRGELLKSEVEYRQKIYQTKKHYLDYLIDAQLVRDEAKRRGITPAELMKAEVGDPGSNVSEEEVRALYDKYKSKIQGSYKQHHDELKAYVVNQKRDQLKRDLLARLRNEGHVEVTLAYPDLPQVEIAGAEGAPAKGAEAAPVTIVEFADFQCPFCRRMVEPLQQVLDAYPGKVRLVYRHFPIATHPLSRSLAEASACAGEQGHFWEYHDLVFAHQEELSEGKLTEFAKQVGVNDDAFKSCVDERRYQQRVETDLAAGRDVGVEGTPAFFVNGRPLFGAVSLQTFHDVIDRELARQ